MQPVEAIVFEPVGCLAEFPAGPFDEIAARFFGANGNVPRSGSQAYWRLLDLMQTPTAPHSEIEALELQAVAAASVYEDVIPALSELQSMGVRLLLASSLSKAAVSAFLHTSATADLFSAVWTRDDAHGINDAPLRIAVASLNPQQTMFLTDTAEGLKTAKSLGLNAVLMMNDPDESLRIATNQKPDGGVVSLLELPDFIRLVAAQSG